MNREVVFHDLGRVHYRASERIQQLLEQDVQLHNRQYLLALEHNPVFTLGKNADRHNLLWSEEELAKNRFNSLKQLEAVTSLTTDQGKSLSIPSSTFIKLEQILVISLGA